MFGECLPCQQAAQRGVAGPAHYHRIQMPDGSWWRTEKDYLAGLGQAAAPRFDMKRDLVAGGLAVATPYVYDKFAPKKWPKLTLLSSVGVAVATYFVAVWVYGKVV